MRIFGVGANLCVRPIQGRHTGLPLQTTNVSLNVYSKLTTPSPLLAREWPAFIQGWYQPHNVLESHDRVNNGDGSIAVKITENFLIRGRLDPLDRDLEENNNVYDGHFAIAVQVSTGPDEQRRGNLPRPLDE